MELVYSYTRKQAIEDGVLIDVTDIAKEAGIKFPVAMTDTVWSGYIQPPGPVASYQDCEGRLWDVLNCLRFAASKTSGDTVTFLVAFRMDEQVQKDVMLKAICGPGDTTEPVITLMLPGED